MRRKTLTVWVMVMIIALLAGCGSKHSRNEEETSCETQENTESSSEEETEESSEATEASVENKTSEPEESEETETSEASAPSEEEKSPSQPTPEKDTSEPAAESSSQAEIPASEAEPAPEPPKEPLPEPTPEEGYTDAVPVAEEAAEQEAAALEDTLQPAQSTVISPQASGAAIAANEYATIDYSNTADGYVMVNYTASTQQRIKAQVTGPTTTYTYNLTPGQWTTFPLSDGNGNYSVKVFENVVDNRYAQVQAVDMSVSLRDEFAPFVRPNQYVNYEIAPSTVATAANLTSGVSDLLPKVEVIYNYVVSNISYDYDKAATVQSGYLPHLDSVLSSGKGICFDYASLMTGMLRSQGIPCKLVVGYAGDVYHAWISVWSAATGWVDGAVYFNGTSWQRMDPTFASSSGKDQATMDFIGNSANYTTKYIY